MQRAEVHVGTSDTEHVLGLAPREAELGQLLLVRLRHPRARRELVGVDAADAEALDHPVPNREGREQRDLLRADGADDRLVRVWRERWPEPGEPRHQLAENLVAFGPGVERVELEAG